jgi:nucleotide-binding universal stress UspA family protein
MKMLVCADGSKHSLKTIGEAVKIAGGCRADQVAIIHVYEDNTDRSAWFGREGYSISKEDMERIKQMWEQDKEKSREILSEAKEVFDQNNIEVQTIFKEGHPAHTIAQVANEEEYDLVVIGSRGLGGLKKLFLGSVSNAVLQEVKSNVLVVK